MSKQPTTNDGLSVTPRSAPLLDQGRPTQLQTATFALGWFWGPDAQFGCLKGVYRTRVGYAGGTTNAPTYKSVGDHSEAFQVDFAPQQISYEALLALVWKGHVATHASLSKQYRPAIFVHDATQRRLAEASRKAHAEALGVQESEVVTPIVDATAFTLAEDYHQKYSLQNEATLAADFKHHYSTAKELIGSTAAARVNGYLAGEGSEAQLREEIDALGLSAAGRARLLERRGVSL